MMIDDVVVARFAVSRYGLRQLHVVSCREIDVVRVMEEREVGEDATWILYEEIGMWHLKMYWRVNHEMDHEKHETHEINDDHEMDHEIHETHETHEINDDHEMDHETHEIHEKGVLGLQEEGNG